MSAPVAGTGGWKIWYKIILIETHNFKELNVQFTVLGRPSVLYYLTSWVLAGKFWRAVASFLTQEHLFWGFWVGWRLGERSWSFLCLAAEGGHRSRHQPVVTSHQLLRLEAQRIMTLDQWLLSSGKGSLRTRWQSEFRQMRPRHITNENWLPKCMNSSRILKVTYTITSPLPSWRKLYVAHVALPLINHSNFESAFGTGNCAARQVRQSMGWEVILDHCLLSPSC